MGGRAGMTMRLGRLCCGEGWELEDTQQEFAGHIGKGPPGMAGLCGYRRKVVEELRRVESSALASGEGPVKRSLLQGTNGLWVWVRRRPREGSHLRGTVMSSQSKVNR